MDIFNVFAIMLTAEFAEDVTVDVKDFIKLAVLDSRVHPLVTPTSAMKFNATASDRYFDNITNIKLKITNLNFFFF